MAPSINPQDLTDLPFALPPLPSQITDPAIPKFISKYYDLSHKASAEDYGALFASDGVFAMNAETAKGPKEIAALRRKIWSDVPNRDHKPLNIYVGASPHELMVHGDVKYKHHAGHETGGDWAAVVKLVVEGGEIKVGEYRVIVDSAHHK